MDDLNLSLQIASLLYQKKAQDITVLEVRHLTVLCDKLIIASGRTANQVSALADSVDQLMAESGCILRRSEGRQEGRWIVLDYGHIMIHLFRVEEREYYDLDCLWNDGSNRISLPFEEAEGN